MSHIVRDAFGDDLPRASGITTAGDPGPGGMLLSPGVGALGTRGHDHVSRVGRLEHQLVGVTAEVGLTVERVGPNVAPVVRYPEARTASDVHAVGVVGVDDRSVDVIVHTRLVRPGHAAVGALEQTALLDASPHGARVARREVDVLQVSDVRWGGEAPVFRGGDVSQSWAVGPALAQVVADEQVRWLRAGEQPYVAVHLGRGEAVDVLFRDAVVTPLPGRAAVVAGVNAALPDAREPGPALLFEQQGVDVVAGERPLSDAPPVSVSLESGYSIQRSDEDLV